MRCPNSTSNPTRAAHAPVRAAQTQAKPVTAAMVANSHSRAIRYVDARVKAVQCDLNAEHARAWRADTHKVRVTFVERVVFLFVVAFVGIVANRLSLTPRIIIAGIAIGPELIRTAPDVVREAIEMFRRV